MSVKVKLTSLITTFILLCSLLAVGVFAVKNTTFNVGGNIEFNVKGIEADINLTDPGTANLAVNNDTPVMQPIQIRNTTTESEIVSAFSTWSNLDLAFSPNKSTATIELEISNKTTDANNYIGISASADALTKNNAEIIVTNNAGGQTALIGKDQTATFTITFKVVDDGYSAKLDNFVVKFDMKKLDTAELPTEGEVNSSITPSNDELTITKEDTTTKAAQTLTETVSSTSQTTTYTYDIKNNSYTESIYLNPTATLSEEQTDVATTIYYSVEDNGISTFSTQSTEYKLLTEDYLVILPQKSVKVQVQMLPINVTSTKEVSLGVELNLHAEKPADFVQDYTYEIIDNEAYRTPICNACECYQATEKMNADEYIIATPETAQEVLDGNISGKTIVFDEGIYADTLYIRPTRASNTKVFSHTDYIASDKTTAYEDMVDSKKYTYVREINDVILAGTENAIFTNELSIVANSSDALLSRHADYYDGVREMYIKDGSSFNLNYKIDNFTITGFNFEGANGHIFINSQVTYTNINNLQLIKNSFITTEVNEGNNINHSAILLKANQPEIIKNVVIKNNIITGHTIGSYNASVYNLKITNNIISQTKGNLIGVHYATGENIIAGNTLSENAKQIETRERAIRFGSTGSTSVANVIIEGNTFIDCREDRTADGEGYQVMKGGSFENTTYTVANNTYASSKAEAPYYLDNQKGQGELIMYVNN